MNTTRSFDFLDMLVGTQKQAYGNPPVKTPHHIGANITEIQNGASSLLTTILNDPYGLHLSHIAIGMDDTAWDPSQYGLIADYSRMPIDIFLPSQTLVPGGYLASQLYQAYFPFYAPAPRAPLAPKDCQTHIKEIGLFGDNGLTMYTRVLLDYNNIPMISGNPTIPSDLMVSFIYQFTPGDYNLTAFVVGNGGFTQSAMPPFSYGANVTLVAVPAGHPFDYWIVNGVKSTNDTQNLVIETNIQAVAYFMLNLTVGVTPSGHGGFSQSAFPLFHYGDIVTLTAVPSGGNSFLYWNINGNAIYKNPLDLKITSDMSAWATFT